MTAMISVAVPAPATAGVDLLIEDLTSSGDTATVTVTDHGLVSGMLVTVTGADAADADIEFNVSAEPITVVDPDTFTYDLSRADVDTATGSPIAVRTAAISGLVSTGTTATATSANHGLLTGAVIDVTGAVQSEYNVTGKAITKTGANSFTYVMDTDPAVDTATGSPVFTCTVALSSLTSANDVATAVHGGADSLLDGTTVAISGATGEDANAFNAPAKVITRVNATTFTYVRDADVEVGTGEPTASFGPVSWTNVYVALDDNVTIGVMNMGNIDLWIRVGAAVVIDDSLDAPAELLRPKESIAIAMDTDDVILAAPIGPDLGAGRVTIRV